MRPSPRPGLRVLLLVVLVALPALLLGVGWLEARRRQERAAEAVMDEVRSLTARLSAEHARLLHDARDLLTVLANVPALRTPEGCRAFLAPLLPRFPRYANLGVLEADGHLRCAARGNGTRLAAAERAYLEQALRSGGFVVTRYQVGQITGVPSLSLAYRTEDGDAVVYASLDLAWIAEALAAAPFPPGTEVILTDAEGTVLATRPSMPGRVGRPAAELPRYAALGDAAEGEVPGQEDGAWLLARAPIQHTGLAAAPEVVVGVPAQAALAAARGDYARELAILGLLGLVVGGIALVADARVFRPLGRIADAARRVGAGDLSARSGVPRERPVTGELAGAFDDMAEAVEANVKRELYLATHDALTGLPNRRALRDRLGALVEEARAEGRAVAVALVIVDHLHDVVNTLGHPTGDELLRQVGPRLREAIGAGAWVARVGGGEFATVLPGRGPDDAEVQRAAHRIATAMTRPFVAAGIEIEPGGSVGIAGFPAHAEDPDLLVQRAGVAAVAARAACAEVAVYSPEVDPWTSRRLHLLGSLRGGLRNGEMSIVFQPKLDLRTRRPAGAEALVRWRHPELGLVSPVEFIGLAEQTGAIRPLTRWVVEQAAACSRRLADAGTPIRISANLSVRDLTDAAFARQVAHILEATKAPPSLMELEVTETILMSDPTLARATLQALRDMGVALSIDDFGTGYCSLAYLRELPVNVVKIDKCFVTGGAGPLRDAALVRTIVALGHDLGLEVLAEGVSSAEIDRALKEAGCDVGQGELYGRPMDEAALSAWLRKLARTPEPA